MYYLLTSEITIASFRFRGVNNVVIKESAKDYMNTCVITLPASAVLKIGGKRQFESVQTAKQFNVGDPVVVKLGYNGALKEEFRGFVSERNFTSPAQIVCEGYSWILRKKKNIKKSWGETTLDAVLAEVVKDTEITLHPDIPKIPMINLAINNASGTQTIDEIKGLFNGVIVFRMIDNVLWAGLAYADTAGETVKYREGWNVISADGLRFKKAEDINVKIEFKFKGSDGVDKSASEGISGDIVRTETVSVTDSAEWLTKMAKAKLQQETYTGFEGSITAFLKPYCRAGYRIDFSSARYPEKDGIYFCASVETTFGQGGARRTVELDLKLS